MTRINVIPPEHLTDQHLIAEWRELPRIFSLARPDNKPVPAYTLGTGHVRFFYSRTGYLARRHAALVAECLSRGFRLKHWTALHPIATVPGLDDDWTPDAAAVAVNLSRLRDKLAMRPGFYTYGGIVVSPDFY